MEDWKMGWWMLIRQGGEPVGREMGEMGDCWEGARGK